MTDSTHNAAHESTGTKRPAIDDLCDFLRQGLYNVCDAVTPPESAREHFRESRLEFLRGLRDIIDHRITRVSRPTQRSGTSVVVE